jgi:response regulator RpfG family c-di-GMP phosphodiesterase
MHARRQEYFSLWIEIILCFLYSWVGRGCVKQPKRLGEERILGAPKSADNANPLEEAGMSESQGSVSVLTVSACEADHVILSHVISHSAWMRRSARTVEEARAVLGREEVHVVLCEEEPPGGGWRELLDELHEMGENRPEMILLTRRADNRLWAEVLNLGVFDVLERPFRHRDVFRAVSGAWRHRVEQARRAVRAASA